MKFALYASFLAVAFRLICQRKETSGFLFLGLNLIWCFLHVVEFALVTTGLWLVLTCIFLTVNTSQGKYIYLMLLSVFVVFQQFRYNSCLDFVLILRACLLRKYAITFEVILLNSNSFISRNPQNDNLLSEVEKHQGGNKNSNVHD